MTPGPSSTDDAYQRSLQPVGAGSGVARRTARSAQFSVVAKALTSPCVNASACESSSHGLLPIGSCDGWRNVTLYTAVCPGSAFVAGAKPDPSVFASPAASLAVHAPAGASVARGIRATKERAAMSTLTGKVASTLPEATSINWAPRLDITRALSMPA